MQIYLEHHKAVDRFLKATKKPVTQYQSPKLKC